MKFTFAFQWGDFGGTERVALNIMKVLMQRGHHCEVITLQPMKGLRPYLEELGLTWYSTDYKRFLGLPALAGISRHLRKSAPDVFVQVAQRPVTTLAAGLSRVPRKIYQCLHHHTGVFPDWMWKANYTLVNNVFDQVTFLSAWCAEEAFALTPAIRPKASVHYPPISLMEKRSPAMRARARAALQLPQDARIVGGLGRLVPVKRFDLFLDVAQRLAKLDPAYYFVIAGAGPELERLQALAAGYGMGERVRWIQWQKDVDLIYQSLDSLLFISDWDAFGMVPCEAFCHGVPAISSQTHGGLSEVLAGEGSYFFRQHDAAALTQAIHALADPQFAARVVDQAREGIARHCDSERLTDHFLSLVQ